jgi:hypothetical protein
LGEHEEESS